MTQKPKHYFVLSDYGGFGICTSDIKLEATATDWKKVTCKNCLKKRKK